MNLEYSKNAVKELKKLPQREQKKILKKTALLKQASLLGKRLKGEFEGLLSLRAWPYRIIYRLDKAKIFIISISHRQGSYK